MENIEVDVTTTSEEVVPEPSPSGGWSKVDKKVTRRLVPQHSLSKQDLGTDSNKKADEAAKKKGNKDSKSRET